MLTDFGCRLCSTHSRCSFSAAPLSANPLTYVARAVEDFDPLFLTISEEADYIHVDEHHLFQFQYPRPIAADLSFELLKMFRSNSADQAENGPTSFRA